MGKYKYLSQKQLAVLDDLFNSDLDEQGVLDKYKVRRSTYERWLDDELFSVRFNRYIHRIRRRSEILITKYRCLAAAKLIELTTSDKPETARRACLDIISQQSAVTERDDGRLMRDDVRKDGAGIQALSPETASKLLAAMAEENLK